ncbi:MAG: DNA-binding transcriptional LysR family regulator [Candidatus Azotimanducaceae bacterium]|jgi:DNA-binding transcriptional LysR family regulator
MGHTTLSRRIELLEHALGTKLFTRQSTGLTLTNAGEEMFSTAILMHKEFYELQTRLFGQENKP